MIHDRDQLSHFRRIDRGQVTILMDVFSQVIQLHPRLTIDGLTNQLPIAYTHSLTALLLMKFPIQKTMLLLALFPQQSRQIRDAIGVCA